MFQVKEIEQLDPSLLSVVDERMEWATGFLVIRYKFVHDILSITRRVQDEKFPTLGVRNLDGLFELIYNPHLIGLDHKKDYPKVKGCTDEELVYLQTHEVMHMILHHCTTRKFDNPELGNMACDLAVNELIPTLYGSCEIPKDESGKYTGIHVEIKEGGGVVGGLMKEKMFSDILHKQTSEWYYDYLQKKQKEHGYKAGMSDNGDGTCTITITDKNGKQTKIKAKMDSHKGWKEDEVADERIRAKVQEIDGKDGWNQAWGSETAGCVELIRAAQRKRINWKNHIRVFYGNQVWTGRQSTRKRPNRRTGFIHPGTKKVEVARHLVGVDTSGSVDNRMLSEFLGVLNGLQDFVPIDLMQFDCSVQTKPMPYDKACKEFDFKGRGGTDFQPVIDLAKERRYLSLLIFTDGEAPAPTKPNNCKVVWVLPEGKNPPCNWGGVIHMSKYA